MKKAGFSVVSVAMMCALPALAGDCSSKSSGCTPEPQVRITKVSHLREGGPMGASSEKNIVETAVASGKFKTLAAALRAADLVDALQAGGPFTVFAPTDEAFAKLGSATLEDLLKPENKAKLAAILTYHVVPTRVLSKDARTMGVATLNGQRLDLVVTDGTVRVGNATVIMADVSASNGVIHAIDTVLLPTDQNVVQVASTAGSFKTLCKLLEVAGLVDTLNGAGPFTVFAPTDEAFAKLDAATVESLLKPENKAKLAAILKYHVVKGRVFSDQAVKAGSAKTAQGESVRITSKNGTVMIDNATVVKPDVQASNGVIHAIDSVIMPK